ncbi:MAG TPA: DUF2851 family protein [Flavobacterium sp.]|jgi:hypothetical protein|nr:DUF2851 family protein [Flavobacterium sp.]
MKEDFLHYLWKFKKFRITNLQTTIGEALTIINTGQYLQLAGPDFFNAQITINDQKWAGNIEIHVKSSDWYLHHHETDKAYENVILHVVWDHDTEIFRSNNTHIPVLQIKDYVDAELLHRYYYLTTPKSWIFCEQYISNTDSFVFKNWLHRIFLERLERKVQPMQMLLEQTNHDWEATLFYSLARNFGLNTNGDAFFSLAQRIPFAVVRKEREDASNIEAMLFGQAGLLNADFQDNYPKTLQSHFDYLKLKYQMEDAATIEVEFFKHRPDNFPTIRLSQLASVYQKNANLLSDVITSPSIKALYSLFNVSVSEYWVTHYQFDRPSPKKNKPLSKQFIDLLIINTIVPIRFAYNKSRG